MKQDDVVDEVLELRTKVSELTFENERLEFELRDAQRELSKYRPQKETEIQVKIKSDHVLSLEPLAFGPDFPCPCGCGTMINGANGICCWTSARTPKEKWPINNRSVP